MSCSGDAGPPAVVVETWLLHCDAGRWWTMPPARYEMGSGDHPHDYAKDAARRVGVTADVVHSTSWRMVNGQVVLTYVVVTSTTLAGEVIDVHDDHDHRWGTEPGHVIDVESDATLPNLRIADRDVLHHAIHHLALLARTNSSVAASLSPAALESLGPLAPAGAGALPASWVA